MKKVFYVAAVCLLLSSCCTLFTGSNQSITFTGETGTKIYDANTKVKIAEIREDNAVTVKVRKRLDDKQLLAKREGYRPAPLVLESTFNAVSLWNILFWPGFVIDLATQKITKWDNTTIEVEMEKKDTKMDD